MSETGHESPLEEQRRLHGVSSTKVTEEQLQGLRECVESYRSVADCHAQMEGMQQYADSARTFAASIDAALARIEELEAEVEMYKFIDILIDIPDPYCHNSAEQMAYKIGYAAGVREQERTCEWRRVGEAVVEGGCGVETTDIMLLSVWEYCPGCGGHIRIAEQQPERAGKSPDHVT